MTTPQFTAEAALDKSNVRYAAQQLPWAGAGAQAIVPQQTMTVCLPCFWGRIRCCDYTHGGDLRCYSRAC
ncbi:MAG TPA: hypothetical protein VNA89_02480 [Gemmatimonadaceae bacterium]|nr:hypothetical protein [Gemmatimonadaceae bacterium]